MNPSVEFSHPLTPPTLDICTDLARKLVGCHVKLFSQHSSSNSIDPPDCIVLCSPIPDSTFIVREDHVVDGVGVEKPTSAIIFYEYVWEPEEELAVKHDLLLFSPYLLFPNIFCDFSISNLSCENSSSNVFTSDHSQNTSDVSLSFDCREDTSFFFILTRLSSFLFENLEDEYFCFSSTPL